MIPNGFQWNQVELGHNDPLSEGLLNIVVIKEDLTLAFIGTAFLVTADGDHATAVSAAHCFQEIRKILHPNQRHHASALPEFLSPPGEIELKRVKAIYKKDGDFYACPIEIAIWDNATDLAVFTISAPPHKQSLFSVYFWLDDQVPSPGEEIAILGYGEIKVISNPVETRAMGMKRTLLLRIGRVEQVFPEGHIMLKGSCIQSSIAIFGGMSGGVVAKWSGRNTKVKPFAFVSHAPDPQPSYDRSKSGHSMASIINAKIEADGNKEQIIRFLVSNIGVGKDGTKSQLFSSFDFTPVKPGNDN